MVATSLRSAHSTKPILSGTVRGQAPANVPLPQIASHAGQLTPPSQSQPAPHTELHWHKIMQTSTRVMDRARMGDGDCSGHTSSQGSSRWFCFPRRRQRSSLSYSLFQTPLILWLTRVQPVYELSCPLPSAC